MSFVLPGNYATPDPKGRVRLTPRQTQVLAGLLDDKPQKQMGQELGISEKTVEYHVGTIRNITKKDLGYRPGVAGITRWAIRQGLVEA